MMQVKLYNLQGEAVKTISLDEQVWGQACAPALLHQVVVAYLANKRADYKHGKTRSQVRGGGRKPWRQKGTGRARAGSIRSPLWRGGGRLFGPTQYRNYTKRLPAAMKRRALLGALQAKATAAEVIVLQNLPTELKTKTFAQIFKKLPSYGRTALLVLPRSDSGVYQAIRNLPRLSSSTAASLNTYDVLRNRYLLITEAALTAMSKAVKR